MRSRQDVSDIRNPIQKGFPQMPSGGLANSRNPILEDATKQNENGYCDLEILETHLEMFLNYFCKYRKQVKRKCNILKDI